MTDHESVWASLPVPLGWVPTPRRLEGEVRTEEVDEEIAWEPGDPLFWDESETTYATYLFNFREIYDHEGNCHCGDASSWPDPFPRDELPETDELTIFLKEVRSIAEARRDVWPLPARS